MICNAYIIDETKDLVWIPDKSYYPDVKLYLAHIHNPKTINPAVKEELFNLIKGGENVIQKCLISKEIN